MWYVHVLTQYIQSITLHVIRPISPSSSNIYYSSIDISFIRKIGTAPNQMMRRENDHPYIVAYGSSRENISRFYIEVEKHLIPVCIFCKQYIVNCVA